MGAEATTSPKVIQDLNSEPINLLLPRALARVNLQYRQVHKLLCFLLKDTVFHFSKIGRCCSNVALTLLCSKNLNTGFLFLKENRDCCIKMSLAKNVLVQKYTKDFELPLCSKRSTLKLVQWLPFENGQSPFYVVNEVTLTVQKSSLKFC